MHRRQLSVFLLCLLIGSVVCLVCWWVFAVHRTVHADALPVTNFSGARLGAATPAAAGPAQARLELADEQADATNMALKKLRQNAKAARRQEKRDAKFWAAFAVKYADKNLRPPGNLDEAAVAAGCWMAEVAQLKAKWGEKVPPAGTPEASAYEQDQEKLMTEMAAWGKFVADPNALAPLAEPDRLAQFQTLSLSGALNLNEGQMQQIDAALSACLEDADARGLNTRVPPQTGATAWNQARTELARRAFNDVNAFLSPEQSAVFTNLYAGNAWLWTLVVGE